MFGVGFEVRRPPHETRSMLLASNDEFRTLTWSTEAVLWQDHPVMYQQTPTRALEPTETKIFPVPYSLLEMGYGVGLKALSVKACVVPEFHPQNSFLKRKRKVLMG